MRQDLTQKKTQESGRVEFAGKALVQIVLTAFKSVSGFTEGVFGKLQNMPGFEYKRCVDGQLSRKVVSTKEIMNSSLDASECVD